MKTISILREMIKKQTTLEQELDNLKVSVTTFKSIDLNQKESIKVVDDFDNMLNDIKNEGVHWTKPNSIVTPTSCASSSPKGNDSGNQCDVNGCNCGPRLKLMEDMIEGLKTEVTGLKHLQESEGSAVKIGGFIFNSREHLLLWARDNLPSVVPYGCFVDVYTFLNRMIDSISSTRSLGNLVDQFKLNLAGDDAVTIDSFQAAHPKIFGPASAMAGLKSASKSWIGSLPSASIWEDPLTSMGMRNRIEEQIPNIREQVISNIDIRLANHPVGRSLAVACLNSTISFVNILSTWITDTHSKLTSHGYSVELSWQLVTQVVYHVFSRDLDKARNFMRDSIDTSNTELLHGSVLWAVFKTHQVMDEYMRRGFGTHPSISAQYLSFLVHSRGKDADQTDSKVNKALTKMEDKVEDVEKIAKEARSAASSVANGLDQLKTKVNRNSRNNGGGGGGSN